ncbi:hypothetical protein OAY12_00530 [Candidatus Pelagibacter sp.]|nr:hypothetical protein [Candidatus Pelagibacter sp.]|tara:strand:+ start:20 stop:226 length:207 start_codon:yes stop_codon:yes gene_type:complete
MKNINLNVKEKLIAKYLVKDQPYSKAKSTDINVLLNRIQLNKKSESRKKIFFSAIASTGLLLFGFIIF